MLSNLCLIQFSQSACPWPATCRPFQFFLSPSHQSQLTSASWPCSCCNTAYLLNTDIFSHDTHKHPNCGFHREKIHASRAASSLSVNSLKIQLKPSAIIPVQQKCNRRHWEYCLKMPQIHPLKRIFSISSQCTCWPLVSTTLLFGVGCFYRTEVVAQGD